MGDKSPKATMKKVAQKQSRSAAIEQQKRDAMAAKSTDGKKK